MATKESIEARAMKKAGEKAEFFIHLIIFVIVNIFLFALNFFTARGSWWFVFPLLGWGVFGVGGHFLSVYVLNDILEDLKEKIYKEEVKKLRKK